jgi:hypothetical protein
VCEPLTCKKDKPVSGSQPEASPHSATTLFSTISALAARQIPRSWLEGPLFGAPGLNVHILSLCCFLRSPSFSTVFSKPNLLDGADLLAPGLLHPALHTVGLPFGCPDIPPPFSLLFQSSHFLPDFEMESYSQLRPRALTRARPPAAAPDCAEPLTTVTRTSNSPAPSGHRTPQRPSSSAPTLVSPT